MMDGRPTGTSRSSFPGWKNELIAGVIAGLACLIVCAPLLSADLGNGASLYFEHCESCHGAGGEGVGGVGELRPWDQLAKTDEELFATVRDRNFSMPGFDGFLTTEEMLDVIAYMRTFQ